MTNASDRLIFPTPAIPASSWPYVTATLAPPWDIEIRSPLAGTVPDGSAGIEKGEADADNVEPLKSRFWPTVMTCGAPNPVPAPPRRDPAGTDQRRLDAIQDLSACDLACDAGLRNDKLVRKSDADVAGASSSIVGIGTSFSAPRDLVSGADPDGRGAASRQKIFEERKLSITREDGIPVLVSQYRRPRSLPMRSMEWLEPTASLQVTGRSAAVTCR